MDGPTRIAGVYAFGTFRLDPVRRSLTHDGAPMELTARLFDTLLYLVENHARIVERDELERAVWGRRHVDGANLAMAISSLRKALQGDEATQTLIATVPGRGYQFAADVAFEPARQAGAGVSLAPALEVPRPDASHKWNRWHAIYAVALLILVGGAAAVWRAVTMPEHNAASTAFTPPPRSIAVLAFGNMGGNPSQDYFSDGLAEELINELSQVGGLQVAARSSAFSFKGKAATVQQIAQRLNVGAVLTGSVGRDGSRLRIEARLVNGVTGAELWSHRYVRDQGDVLNLQREFAEAVTSALRVRLVGSDVTGLTLGGTANPKALDAYLRAMAAHRGQNSSEADYRHIMDLFDQAIALDPDFAIAQAERARNLWSVAAHTSVGDRKFVNGLKDASLAGAQKAVSLAPNLAVAHMALATALGAYLPDFRKQEAEFARARELAPGNADVARGYSAFEGFAGHGARAVAAAEQAVALDPLNAESYVRLAWASFWSRRLDEAQASLRHARELGGSGGTRFDYLEGSIDILRGDAAAALRPCHDDRSWEMNECLAIAYHALGKPKEAMAQVAKLDALGAEWGPYAYAVIYAQWGRLDDALTWLEKAYKLPDLGISQIEADPFLDPIRQMPRFKEIERRLDVAP
jgi:TolB-like protein/DNA-binding winged helix-turn-helix (wHTH) protein